MPKLRADNFRRFHRRSGEPVRWWKAFSTSDGIKYFEQEIAEDVRVLVSEDLRIFEEEESFQAKIGMLKHSGLPDEIELSQHDRTLYPWRWRSAHHEDSFDQSNEITLPRLFIHSVQGIYGNGALVNSEFYELDGRAVRWLGVGEAPEMVAIAYKYIPQYEFMGEIDKQAPMGADGRLPQIVPVHLLAEGDEIE